MKHTQKHLIQALALAALPFAFLTCGGGGSRPPAPPDVHIVGYENSADGVKVAKYWRSNKGAIALSDERSGASGEARDLFVSSDDAYIAGWEEYLPDNGDYTTYIAKIWKNGGLLYSLTDGLYNAVAYGVFVSGNDVYAAGSEHNGTINIAKVWKNGNVLYNLNPGPYSASAQSIFVQGSDVYVSGYEYNAQGVRVAKVWKNGALLYNLTNGANTAYAWSISVSGSNVYVAGCENIVAGDVTDVQYRDAKLWTNGAAQNIGAGTGYSDAMTVHVSGSDVYVALSEANSSGVLMAKYWKNGTLHNLGDGSLRSGAYGVFSHGGNVHAAGQELNQSGIRVAKYWNNGQSYPLSSGNYESVALKVFVK